MSQAGNIIDAAILRLRVAVPGLPAGATGVERTLRQVGKLTTGEYPHAFVHSPAEIIELAPGPSLLHSGDFVIDLWTDDDDQDALLVFVEAFVLDLHTNPDLNDATLLNAPTGLKGCRVDSYVIQEHADTKRKGARITVGYERAT